MCVYVCVCVCVCVCLCIGLDRAASPLSKDCSFCLLELFLLLCTYNTMLSGNGHHTYMYHVDEYSDGSRSLHWQEGLVGIYHLHLSIDILEHPSTLN